MFKSLRSSIFADEFSSFAMQTFCFSFLNHFHHLFTHLMLSIRDILIINNLFEMFALFTRYFLIFCVEFFECSPHIVIEYFLLFDSLLFKYHRSKSHRFKTTVRCILACLWKGVQEAEADKNALHTRCNV